MFIKTYEQGRGAISSESRVCDDLLKTSRNTNIVSEQPLTEDRHFTTSGVKEDSKRAHDLLKTSRNTKIISEQHSTPTHKTSVEE